MFFSQSFFFLLNLYLIFIWFQKTKFSFFSILFQTHKKVILIVWQKIKKLFPEKIFFFILKLHFFLKKFFHLVSVT